MIYLDNAATTGRKPPEVAEAVAKAISSEMPGGVLMVRLFKLPGLFTEQESFWQSF